MIQRAVTFMIVIMMISMSGCVMFNDDDGEQEPYYRPTTPDLDDPSDEPTDTGQNNTTGEPGESSQNNTVPAVNVTDQNNTDVEASTVAYLGFLDNSSIFGYRMDPGNFSRIHVPINEENCTTTGYDDLLGVYASPLCVQDFGSNGTYNETLDCLTVSNETQEACVEEVNMRISGRVMWWEESDGWSTNCMVFINSERFVSSTTYNLTVVNVSWDDLWADPAYAVWESDRLSAYQAESGNQPAWCVDPIFDRWHWANQIDESPAQGPVGSAGLSIATASAEDHVDEVSAGLNDHLMNVELTRSQNMDLNWSNMTIVLYDDHDDGVGTNPIICSNPGHPTNSDCSIIEVLGNGDDVFDVGEIITISEQGVDICSSDPCEKYVVIFEGTSHSNLANNQPIAINQVYMQ